MVKTNNNLRGVAMKRKIYLKKVFLQSVVYINLFLIIILFIQDIFAQYKDAERKYDKTFFI